MVDRCHGLPGLLGHDDMRDRFTGRQWTLSRTLACQLAELTAANELDLCPHGTLAPAMTPKLLAYIRSLRPLVRPTVARAIDALTRDGPCT